jgi:Sporulation and spore germination
MSTDLKYAMGILGLAVLIGLVSLRGLHQRIEHLAESESSEEQARRELLEPLMATPTDVKVNAKIFWAAGPDRLAPVDVELALSADPVQRSKQVLHALIASPPSPGQRTIPADAALLGFYILPDGTAIADFSDALSTETPSGILSEELAVNSIARTLENNVGVLQRLKILIHGQEAETLAGHVDLTGFFDLNPPSPPQPPPTSPATSSGAASPAPPGAVPGNGPSNAS